MWYRLICCCHLHGFLRMNSITFLSELMESIRMKVILENV